MLNTANDFWIMLKDLQQMHLKLFQKRIIQKTAEATGNLICNKIADSIFKVSKNSR